jgi:hypothetical protein
MYYVLIEIFDEFEIKQFLHTQNFSMDHLGGCRTFKFNNITHEYNRF